jgi:hypothetical protein
VPRSEWRCYFPRQFDDRRHETGYRAITANLLVPAKLAQVDNTKARSENMAIRHWGLHLARSSIAPKLIRVAKMQVRPAGQGSTSAAFRRERVQDIDLIGDTAAYRGLLLFQGRRVTSPQFKWCDRAFARAIAEMKSPSNAKA